ncbi:MAG: nucleoside deaminase [candidate division Zixibacteria bacterium]|nr:nucleoside deaminase [candidate division Zixibacteria bacterium]MDH3936241.1 nucleoside deaminase [candidate division Zixibacteria bacterium]MDH4033191.1 nucleoside deaminase [candidate division Zixibacteria bacterium]
MDQLRQQQFMEMALHEASLAFEAGEIPVGALVVFEDRVIGRGHNRTRQLHDASAHAEMIALSAAYNHFGDWRLENCVLISTLEPCPMCAGAAMLSRIKTIIYGAADPKFGACGSIIDIPAEDQFNHRMEVVAGVREDEVSALMKSFFKKLRDDKERVN